MSGPITAPPLPPGIGSAPNIVSVLQLAKAKGIVMLIHADSGVGKTSLLRTLPAERTIVYDIDGGVGGLSDPGKPGTPYDPPYGSFEVFHSDAGVLSPTGVQFPGWYWWPCFPGCLPDGDANGPFTTEAEALADAQDVEVEA